MLIVIKLVAKSLQLQTRTAAPLSTLRCASRKEELKVQVTRLINNIMVIMSRLPQSRRTRLTIYSSSPSWWVVRQESAKVAVQQGRILTPPISNRSSTSSRTNRRITRHPHQERCNNKHSYRKLAAIKRDENEFSLAS